MHQIRTMFANVNLAFSKVDVWDFDAKAKLNLVLGGKLCGGINITELR
jgi:hypothetical protein